jgi:hypothetical protein
MERVIWWRGLGNGRLEQLEESGPAVFTSRLVWRKHAVMMASFLCRRNFSAAVIGVASEDGDRPIDLFKQEDTDELVRPRRLSEGDAKVGSLGQAGR